MGLREKQEERRQRQAADAEARTPGGRARAARENGDALLHLTIPTAEAGEALPTVTAEGWHLTNMAVGFLPGQQVGLPGSKGSVTFVNGTMMGYYVFARSSGTV